MTICLRSNLLLWLLSAFFLSSCVKDENNVADPESEIFNFIVTDSQLEHINSSRGEQYEVTDPVPGWNLPGRLIPLTGSK